MRILFDIVHPADVLFFKRPIEMLVARGDAVKIVSRHKDVACGLLDEFGFPHRVISRAGRGVFGLAAELIRRDFSLLKVTRRFHPDVMIGFGGVAISHVGRLTDTPSISFYDSENARLQARVTWPFISRLYVPESYSGPTPDMRTIRVPGTKELSYLHPSGFTPDWTQAVACGLDPERDNFFVRVVSWRANHDLGKSGWTDETLRSVIGRLGAMGKVHLSSERLLADDLEPLRYRGPISSVHHLMAHCRLLVGESATMASEAAILGVPAIYCGHDFPGYVRELEQAGLLRTVRPGETHRLPETIDAALASPVTAARDRYVAARPDWAGVVVTALDDVAGRCAGE